MIIQVGGFPRTLLVCNSIWLTIFKGGIGELLQRSARCRRLYHGLLLVMRRTEQKHAGFVWTPAGIPFLSWLASRLIRPCLLIRVVLEQDNPRVSRGG